MAVSQHINNKMEEKGKHIKRERESKSNDLNVPPFLDTNHED